MAVTSRHNKYTSIPDWFSGQSTETATTSSSVSQTVYISGSSGSTTTDSTVDFKDIPIDASTIVWQNELLTVPIDNDKIIIVDGKLTTSLNSDGVWELRLLADGTNYIYTTYPVVTQLGITMYSGTEGLDIGGIYDGLPIDNTTIYWDIDSNGNKVLKAIGSSSGGGVADSVAWANVVGKPMWLLDNKISYSEIEGTPDLSKYALVSQIPSLEGYALSSDLAKYIPIAGATDITGEKNFIGGLKVNGSPIYYDEEKKYWKLEGDLLVTGGVTMYGNDSDFVASTIMDAILYDSNTLGINSSGQLYVKGSVGGATTMGSLSNVGSWADSVASQDRIMYQAANSSQWVAKNLSDLAVGGVTGDYLPLTGGTIIGSQRVVLSLQSSQSYGAVLNLNDGNGNGITGFGHIPKSASTRYGAYWANIESNVGIMLASDGKPYIFNDVNNLEPKYEILHSANYSSYALPLSGGTIKSTAVPQLILQGESTDAYITFKTTLNTANSAHSGVVNLPSVGASASFGVSDRIVFPFSGGMYYRNGYNGTNQTIWHAGNDGPASGLDADLLDGKHLRDIIRYEGRNDNGNDAASAQTITYWGEGNWGHGYTYGTSLNIQGADSWNHRLDFRTDGVLDYYQGINTGAMTHIGTIAFTSSNVASATKLATPRTIWGQSFDGTSDISGSLVIDNPYITWGSLMVGGTSYFGGRVYLFDNVSNDANNSSTRLYFAASGYDKGVFLQGINVATYGRKRLGIFVNNEESYNATTWIEALSVLPNGNVGIGTTSPSQKLHVAGNILTTGGITMYSARKLKTIQDERGLSLEELSVIKPTRFTWKDGRDDKVHIGGIADDVMKVLPEVIYKAGEDDTLTMDYGNAAFAIAASLIKPVISHEERIKTLEEENKRLKEEVEQLKWNIA